MSAHHTIVIGLGTMGSATAYHLARRGKRVLGLERFTAVHDQGAHHGQSRIYRLAYGDRPDYRRLLVRAHEMWLSLDSTTDEPVLQRTGALILGEGGGLDYVRAAASAASDDGLPHERLDAREVRRRFPQFHLPDGGEALLETIGGVVFPEATVRAHLAGAARAGAELHFEEPVVSWRADAAGVVVTTGRADYRAQRLVICAGAYAPQLLQSSGVPLKAQRNVLYWLAPTANRDAFAVDRAPVFIWEPGSGPAPYGFPELPSDPRGVKIAFHHHGPDVTPETIDRTVHSHEIERIRAFARQRIPDIADGELVAAATCMYTNTPDTDFVLDLHPDHPQVVVASPCSGHGFKFAPVIGEILADLAESGATRHDIAAFSLSRF